MRAMRSPVESRYTPGRMTRKERTVTWLGLRGVRTNRRVSRVERRRLNRTSTSPMTSGLLGLEVRSRVRGFAHRCSYPTPQRYGAKNVAGKRQRSRARLLVEGNWV